MLTGIYIIGCILIFLLTSLSSFAQSDSMVFSGYAKTNDVSFLYKTKGNPSANVYIPGRGLYGWCDTCFNQPNDTITFARSVSWPNGTGWINTLTPKITSLIPSFQTLFQTFNTVYSNIGDSLQVFNSLGRVKNKVLKTWRDSVLLTGASPFEVDVSSAGFTGIANIQVTAGNNTSVVASMPLVSVKSYSTTKVVLNVINSNTTIVNILGTVATGLTAVTNLAGMKVFLRVDGY